MGRRQQVSLRVKVRNRRRRIFTKLFFIIAAGSVAWIGFKAADLPARLRRWAGPALVVVTVDAAGVPEPARADVERAMQPWVARSVGFFDVGRLERQLRERFGYLEGLRLERSFASREVKAEARLKAPVARVVSSGAVRWLGADGVVFDAPPGLFSGPLPELRAPKEAVDLKPLVSLLAELGPKLKVQRIEYAGPEEGWTFWDADGLKLRWGDLTRGAEKLQRLAQVLDDAKGRYKDVASADLRFFEDGRVLIEPRGAVGRTGR
jgi:hypothetical protein